MPNYTVFSRKLLTNYGPLKCFTTQEWGSSQMCNLYVQSADRVWTQRCWRAVRGMEMWFFSCRETWADPLLCCLYRKRSERRLIRLMKPSNSSSVKCLIGSLLSFSSFFFCFPSSLFSQLSASSVFHTLYTFTFFFFFCSVFLFPLLSLPLFAGCPSNEQTKLRGKRGCL